MLGGLTGPREGNVVAAGRDSWGGCGAVLLSGHSLASMSVEPAPQMSVRLVGCTQRGAQPGAAHSFFPSHLLLGGAQGVCDPCFCLKQWPEDSR